MSDDVDDDDACDVHRVAKRLTRARESRADVRTPAREDDDDRARRSETDDAAADDREDENVNDDDDDASPRRCASSSSSRVTDRERRDAVPPATLAMDHWTRDEETTRRKRAHVDALDAAGGYYGVEDEIERTVLANADVAIEVNMFPYDTPRGVTHMTLWSRREMSEREVVDWTSRWLREHRKRCAAWNFDMNAHNSVDVPHYHVFTYEEPEEAVEAVEAAAVEEAVEEAARGAKRARMNDDSLK